MDSRAPTTWAGVDDDGRAGPDVTTALKAQLKRLLEFNPGGNAKAVADVGHTDFRRPTTPTSCPASSLRPSASARSFRITP